MGKPEQNIRVFEEVFEELVPTRGRIVFVIGEQSMTTTVDKTNLQHVVILVTSN
jgi:hypothetical protein